MSYLVLARRWRPQRFEQVVGQRPVTQTLKNAIASGRVAHAFLFAGPRGVGKTTVARILAKAMNCEKGPATEPCDGCISCQEIAAGRSLSCIEIDGASNRGIDEVRELRENVRYSAGSGKYKMIIIDEVHMLTEPAFNALLKTLEEPPPRVIFILATTEPHKVPATIRSRCQRYDFKRIGERETVEHLRRISIEEGVKIGEEGLMAITRASEGSLRDAQSLLDQAISYSNGEIGPEDLQAVLDMVEGEAIETCIKAIIEKDMASLLEIVDRLYQRGQDLRAFCLSLLEHLRHILVIKVSQRPESLIGLTSVDLENLRNLAKGLTEAEIEILIRVISQAEQDMRRLPYPRIVLEMALVRMSEVKALESLETLLDRLEDLESRLFAASPSSSLGLPFHPLEDYGGEKALLTVTPPEEKAPISKEEVDIEEGWARAKKDLEKEKVLFALLKETRSVTLEGDVLILTLDNGNSYLRSTMEDKENRARIEDAVSRAFGKKLKVAYRYLSGGERHKSENTAGKRGRAEDESRQSLRNYPLVREALEVFQGRIIETKEGH